MPKLADLWFRLRALVRPGAMERELDQEFAFHLEMETEKLIRQGVEPAAAVAEARRRFGGSVQARQGVRDSWGVGMIRDGATDVRHALRQFRRRPAYSALGILTLALGLGATLGLFGVVRSVLLRPLPIADEAGLRVFWNDYDWRGVEFDFLQERTRAFSRLAAYSADGASFRGEAGTSVILNGVASAEFFDVLGARPLMGRTFRAGEDRPGAEPVAVLSYGMWQQELGADPAVIGRRIVLDGRPVTVIGVMPRGFFFPTPEFRLWTPLPLDPATGSYHGNGWLVLMGRVRPGTAPNQVDDDVAAMARALGERFTYPAAWDKTKGAHVRPVREYLVGDVRPALLLLLGAGTLLLLMACANVAALVLARTTDRSQEIALRAALGAGRGRLVRQVVAESLTFSILAGVVGLGIATAGLDLLVGRLPLRGGFESTVVLDWSAYLVALLLAAAVGLFVAMAPVRDLLAGRLRGVSGSRAAAGLARGTGRVHSVLVGAEAAVAVVLVVGALLLIRSVSTLLRLDPGFDPTGAVSVGVIASGEEFPSARRAQAFRDLRERVLQLPGVTGAAWVGRLPLRDDGWQGTVDIEGRPELQGATAPNALYRPVSADFFQTMRIPIVAGRPIEAIDREETLRVGVVDRAFAERAWPGEDPLGRRVRTGVGGDTTAITIVGVAEVVRWSALTGSNPFVLYVAEEQRPPSTGKSLVVRSTGNPAAALGAVDRVIRDVDPRLAVTQPTTLERIVAGSMAEPLRLRFFLALFAGLALTLGLVGIYSVVSYSVSRRQTELGLRMALGAAPGQVLRQIIGEGVTPVAVGTGVGLAAALALAQVVSRFLYGVSAADPLSLAGAALALLGAGVAAAFVPALRASRLSPVDSLRAD